MLGLAIVVGLVAVLLGYVVRVMLTVVLIAGAPIALMFHALPQTEGIARWWWRTFAACLGIQVVQSLTLITALNLLLQPGRGFSVFTEPGGTGGPPQNQALPTVLAVLALLFILNRIPFWLLAGSRVGHGRSRGEGPGPHFPIALPQPICQVGADMAGTATNGEGTRPDVAASIRAGSSK
jgi:hypothetical protein